MIFGDFVLQESENRSFFLGIELILQGTFDEQRNEKVIQRLFFFSVYSCMIMTCMARRNTGRA